MLSLSRLRAVPALASPRSGRFFLGWWVVGAGLCLGGLGTMLFMQAYGAYIVLLRQDFGWSKTLLSSGFSLGQAQAGVLGPVQGMLTDRLGPRFVARMGVLAMGAGFALFSVVNSIPLFFVAMFLTFFGVHMSGFLTTTIAAVNWFERKRARAISVISLGVAAGGLLVPVTVFAMDTFGWRPTALGSGIAIVALGFPLAGLLYHRPENYGLRVDGDPPGEPPAARQSASAVDDQPAQELTTRPGRDFTVREALRTRQFWFIACGHGSALLVVSSMMVHLVPHVNESRGYSLGLASLCVAFLTVSQAIGNLSGGFLGDRYSKQLVATICMFVHAAAMALLAYAPIFPLILLASVMHGLAWGTRGPLMMAIRADYFGRTSYGTIVGVSQPIVMLGMTTGPIVAGFLYDQTGSYEVGFTTLATLAALGSVFFMLATRPMRPGEEAAS